MATTTSGTPDRSVRLPFRQTQASVLLDLLRGLAAVLVLIDHGQRLFYVNQDTALQTSAHPGLMKFFFTLTAAGPQPVDVFLVLSGYLISGSVFRWLADGRWSWRRYLTHRLVRLWLVLLPALVLGALWDAVRVAHTAGLPGFARALRLQAGAEGLTWTGFWGNLLFLQKIRVDTFGSNRVLWSLAIEFWYYLLFPVALFALRRGTSLWQRVLYGAAFVALAAFVGRGVLGLFPVWLLGTALACLRPPTLSRFARWGALAMYVPVFFLFAVEPWKGHLLKPDYLLGVFTVLFLLVLLSAREQAGEDGGFVRFSRGLAGFSYSLYLVHYPLLACAAACLLPGHAWPVDGPHVLAGTGLMLLALLYSFAVASVTEAHTDRIRAAVERHLRLEPKRDRRVFVAG